MIKTLLVDDHEIVRTGLKLVFDPEADGVQIAGEAATGQQAVDFLHREPIDVVLMDISMPDMDGIQATRLIREQFPQVKVVLLTMLDKEHFVLEATQAGAQGYVLKTAGYKEILHAIRTVHGGEEYYSKDVTKMLIRTLQSMHPSKTHLVQAGGQAAKEPVALPADISPRELQVLKLIAEGYTTAEIAERLFNSKRTIETHRQNLLAKTNTNNTAALIRFAVQQGFVD